MSTRMRLAVVHPFKALTCPLFCSVVVPLAGLLSSSVVVVVSRLFPDNGIMVSRYQGRGENVLMET